jgi:hypothetical protein
MDRAAVAATEGQIGAVNDESWVAVDLSDDLSGDGGDDGVAIEDRPVFRTEKIKGVLLHPYRYECSTPPLKFQNRLPAPKRSLARSPAALDAGGRESLLTTPSENSSRSQTASRCPHLVGVKLVLLDCSKLTTVV